MSSAAIFLGGALRVYKFDTVVPRYSILISTFQYGLKKKVPGEDNMMQPPEDAGRIGRKKKTPAELAAEANADSDDEDNLSKFSSLCCCMNFV